MKHIAATEAKAKFSELLSAVASTHEPITIERHGKPVAVLVSVEDAPHAEQAPATAQPQLGALGLIGAWGDVEDSFIEQMIKDIYDARDKDLGREVNLELD